MKEVKEIMREYSIMMYVGEGKFLFNLVIPLFVSRNNLFIKLHICHDDPVASCDPLTLLFSSKRMIFFEVRFCL